MYNIFFVRFCEHFISDEVLHCGR